MLTGKKGELFRCYHFCDDTRWNGFWM